MGRNLRHAGERADQQVGAFDPDATHRQRVDVDKSLGTFHFLAHQIDQRSSAGDISPTRGGGTDRILLRERLLEAEGDHRWLFAAASAIAATIPG